MPSLKTAYGGPNGNPNDNDGFFTQKQRYNDYKAWADADAEARKDGNIISYDSKRYDNWEKMHDGVIWFDTKACWEGSYIGKANEAVYSGSWSGVGGWHTDTAVDAQ